MRITIEIDTSNAAFEDTPGAELRMVAMQAVGLVLMATRGLEPVPGAPIRALLDSNGNACGRVEVTP